MSGSSLDPMARRYRHQHKPRMSCRSVPAVLEAIYAGGRVGLLPDHICAEGIAMAASCAFCPTIRCPRRRSISCSRHRGASPTAVRALVDFLVEQFRNFSRRPPSARKRRHCPMPDRLRDLSGASASIGLVEGCNIDLHHLHHRSLYAHRFLRVRIVEIAHQRIRV